MAAQAPASPPAGFEYTLTRTHTAANRTNKLENIAALANGHTTSTIHLPDRPHLRSKDVCSEVRYQIVAEYFRHCRSGGARLSRGAMVQFQNAIAHHNVSRKTVMKIMREYRLHAAAGTLRQHFADPYPQRHNSGTSTKADVGIFRMITFVNLKYLGELSNAQLSEKLQEEGGVAVHEDTIRRWCKAMGSKKMRMYLMPTLNDKQKLDRLDFALNEVGTARMEFGKKCNEVMIDEAWFYLRKDGRKVRMMKNPDL